MQGSFPASMTGSLVQWHITSRVEQHIMMYCHQKNSEKKGRYVHIHDENKDLFLSEMWLLSLLTSQNTADKISYRNSTKSKKSNLIPENLV